MPDIIYRKLEKADIDVFIKMRMLQLQEEGAQAIVDSEKAMGVRCNDL